MARAARERRLSAHLIANGVQLDDLALWITLGIILGGRLGYALFYKPVMFAQLFTGGVNYGVPHGRGPNLLAYNTDVIKTAPTSWESTETGISGASPCTRIWTACGCSAGTGSPRLSYADGDSSWTTRPASSPMSSLGASVTGTWSTTSATDEATEGLNTPVPNWRSPASPAAPAAAPATVTSSDWRAWLSSTGVIVSTRPSFSVLPRRARMSPSWSTAGIEGFTRTVAIVEADVALFVVRERPRVEVGAADGQPRPVHDHQLVVHELEQIRVGLLEPHLAAGRAVGQVRHVRQISLASVCLQELRERVLRIAANHEVDLRLAGEDLGVFQVAVLPAEHEGGRWEMRLRPARGALQRRGVPHVNAVGLLAGAWRVGGSAVRPSRPTRTSPCCSRAGQSRVPRQAPPGTPPH